jgi:hypothetical protein
MTPGRLRTTLVAAAALALAAPAAAPAQTAPGQDLDGQLLEVRTLLQERRYPLALESLRYIARQVQDLRMGEIRALFPEPTGGWTASPPISLLDEHEIWGTRVEARRSYLQEGGGSKVELTIGAQSPLVPTVLLGFNPLFVAGDPLARLVEVGGEQGLLRFSPDTGEGELRIVIGRDLLVTCSGRGLSSGDALVAFARLLDFPALRSRAGR